MKKKRNHATEIYIPGVGKAYSPKGISEKMGIDRACIYKYVETGMLNPCAMFPKKIFITEAELIRCFTPKSRQ